MQHKGRHALVTGGGTGIGLAIARLLATEGAEVTITGRRADVLDQAATGVPGLHPLACDVTEDAEFRLALRSAANARGPVSICIANAGIAEGQPFSQMTLDQWRKTLSINLDGAFTTFQAALSTLEPDSWGRMIAISSIAGVRGLRGAVHYTASKHGMIGLIRGLSEEYLRTPITFNAVCPGYVDTDIVARQAPQIAKRMGISEDEARAYLAKGNRNRILLDSDEVAETVGWLCSDGARNVNGQTIQIAGGQIAG